MKKYFFILILLFASCAVSFAVEKIYLQENYPYSINRRYNPYGYYNNSYCNHCRYRNNAYNSAKRIQRIQKIRLLNRIRNNFLTWNNFNNGSLTGYSTPISPNVYSQLGTSPWDKLEYQHKSPTLTTELFSSPVVNETYYRNGEVIRDNDGASSKTGVTIIYD